MAVLALLVAVFLLGQVPCESRGTPEEYSRTLKEISETDGYGEPFHDLPESDSPHHQDGVKIIHSVVVVPEKGAECKPRLAAVDVRGNRNRFSVLFKVTHVELNRCGGSPSLFHQQLLRCAATEAEEVTFQIFEYFSQKWQFIKLLNHTKCDEDCIVQASDCDSSKEDYDKATCSCKCKEDGSSCDSQVQIWDTTDCKCKCKDAPLPCLGRNGKEEWNTQTCKCECSQSVKDNCTRLKRVLDSSSCSCV